MILDQSDKNFLIQVLAAHFLKPCGTVPEQASVAEPLNPVSALCLS